jgi:quinol monooxygenase YgiN
MIIVTGTMDVTPEQRDAFLESKREQVLHTRNEAGCHDYVFSADAYAPGRVRLFELWDSYSDLEAHIAGIQSIRHSEPSIPVEGTKFHIYEATLRTPTEA